MKKTTIAILFFTLIIKVVNGQVLKDIKVFYYDDQTVKGQKTYRELKGIGENPWSKPEKLDIILYFNNHSYSDGDRIEILIEELYEPTSIWKKSSEELTTKRWVPHQVVFSDISSFLKSNKIVVKNWPYQTAYFTDSMLYTKDAFRIVGVFFDKNSNKIERIMKTFKYGD
jgi:hypothetical protein